MVKRNTVSSIQKKAAEGEKLVMVTAYDYPMARMADAAGVDMILVGDSLGNTVLGYDSTLPVTLEEVLHHTRPVVRGSERAMVVLDMPFGSYQISEEQALANCIRALKEGGAGAVKLEGGKEMAPLVAELTKKGVPVMAHIGLLPQTAMLWEGYRVQGRDEDSAWMLVEAAQALEAAGAFALLLECMTTHVAKLVTEKVDIPTIGIGAGPDCRGQVLVFHDLLGLGDDDAPKFVRRFAEGRALLEQGLKDYCAAVRDGSFPSAEYFYAMNADEAKRLY